MLIAVHVEPFVPYAMQKGLDWKSLQEQAWELLFETRDALAPGPASRCSPTRSSGAGCATWFASSTLTC